MISVLWDLGNVRFRLCGIYVVWDLDSVGFRLCGVYKFRWCGI